MSRPLPYPDLYTLKDRSRLPPALQTALFELGKAIREGTLHPEQIDAFRVALAELPASAVVDAAGVISKCAKLNRRVDWSTCSQPSERSIFDELKRDLPEGLLSVKAPFLTKELRLMQTHPHLCWLFAYHDSGYVRQMAMQLIDMPPASPFDVGTLVYRMNDWVAAVRKVALDSAKRLLPLTDTAVIADSALFLLDYSKHLIRWDPEARALVDTAMQRSECLAAIIELICESRDGTGAKGLKALLPNEDLDPHIPTLAAEASQPHLRALAMRILLSGEVSWIDGYKPGLIEDYRGRFMQERNVVCRPLGLKVDLDFWIEAAASDKSASVRKLAADALIARRETASPALDALALQLCTDRNEAVAERARFYLEKRSSEPVMN